MVEASMFEAKTQLSDLVKRAQRGEKIVLTTGRNRTPVAEIVALKPARSGNSTCFPILNLQIPTDFDELPNSN